MPKLERRDLIRSSPYRLNRGNGVPCPGQDGVCFSVFHCPRTRQRPRAAAWSAAGSRPMSSNLSSCRGLQGRGNRSAQHEPKFARSNIVEVQFRRPRIRCRSGIKDQLTESKARRGANCQGRENRTELRHPYSFQIAEPMAMFLEQRIELGLGNRGRVPCSRWFKLSYFHEEMHLRGRATQKSRKASVVRRASHTFLLQDTAFDMVESPGRTLSNEHQGA